MGLGKKIAKKAEEIVLGKTEQGVQSVTDAVKKAAPKKEGR